MTSIMQYAFLYLHAAFMIVYSHAALSSRPNIVVIMADDLGWNDVGFHGSDQIPTPNIDALAYHGVILNRHYTMPVCTPSRAAFLTGKYPIRMGMQVFPIKCGEPRGLPLQETLLPQRLKDLGYVTRLVGKWHLGYMLPEYTPTKRGFDSHLGYWNGYISYFDHVVDRGEMVGYDFRRDLNLTWEGYGEYATDLFTQEAVRLISTHDTTKPLFLEVAHLAVHSGREIKELEVPDHDEAMNRFSYIPDTKRRLFTEMTKILDDSVGEIVTALSEKGILNNTIIIFLSDNGAQTIGLHENWGSNWPLRGLKFSLYEGGVRGVAAVWSSSLQNPGRVSKQMMHISDWFPTIYSMAGGEVSELGEIDGVNYWSYFLTGSNEDLRTGMLLNIGEKKNDMEAIIEGKWKLIRSTHQNGKYDGYFGENGRGIPNPPYDEESIISSPVFKILQPFHTKDVQNKIKDLRSEATVNCSESNRAPIRSPYCPHHCLFDIEEDPCENKNLVSEYPQIVQELKKKLRQFRSVMVPDLVKDVDPNSNPIYYNNTWVSWLEHENVEILDKYEYKTNNYSVSVSEVADSNLHLLLMLIIIHALFKHFYS